MKRIRIMGLCLVAVFAFSVVGVVSVAGAAVSDEGPERGLCKPAAKGKGVYTDSHCEEAGEKGGAKKEFVWVPQGAVTHAFTSTTGPATLKSFTPEGAELPAVECTSSKGKGKTGTTESTSVVTFSGCTSAGEKCTGGAKAKPGQIVTFTLDGKLGLINDTAEADDVGEDLVGTGPGGLSSEFKCGANEIKTRGSVIGTLTPVETKTTTFTLVFAATGMKQNPEKFEGGSKDTLESEIDGLGGGTFPFASTEETTATVKGSATEIRA